MLVVALAGISQWAVNLGLLLPAVKGSDPTTRLRELLLTREVVQNDVAELCVAVLVTLAVAISALTIVFALPFVTLLQRSLRHNQLVNASRIDSKTGLLNAGTWEREAAAEVARAVRTRTPLALALVDIDHFKIVNDTFGHLVGDRALRSIARTFRIFLREYDLVGRFGGEEFALLLPHTMALDAYGIAERIRDHIASSALDVGNLPEGGQVRVTVSMGVAALGGPWDSGTQITDLLAAADRALYGAKRAGRDQVCVVTENAVVNSPAEVGRLGQV
jgi:diguanylate cyclase (GGDEF)-like protein